MKLALMLQKARGRRACRSPPPELETRVARKRKPRDKWANVACKVDATPPVLHPDRLLKALWGAPRAVDIQLENTRLLRAIRNNHFTRGRVDSRWRTPPSRPLQHYQARVEFAARVQADNRRLHRLFTCATSRLTPTAALERWWAAARRERERRARAPWLLAPPPPPPDLVFDAPEGVKRPRVRLQLRVRGGAALGALRLELFSEACPRTAALFLALLPNYVGTRFYRAIAHFYPTGSLGAARYRLVRVGDARALHDLLTLAQAQLEPQEELLLVERPAAAATAPGAELGAVRAPAAAGVAAATAALPAPRRVPRAPDLQALLATDDLQHELRKILISLVEAGARLAAGGPHYETALAQLTAALTEPRPAPRPVQEVITPEEIALRMAEEQPAGPAPPAPAAGAGAYPRAEQLQKFLDKFRAWRGGHAEEPRAAAVAALVELGFEAAAAAAALARVGGGAAAAAAWLAGERGPSVCDLADGLPDGEVLRALLKQPQIQRGLMNTRLVGAFAAASARAGGAALWLASPRGGPLLGHISRTYHAEKYCLAVNQFSDAPGAERDLPAPERKVPALYWSGGDVARAGAEPLPALAAPENFHFSHSAPGLLAMHVDGDGEVLGAFSIMFKPLPQFDLRSVVFGRVVFPSRTYEVIRTLGAALSTQPVVEISAAAVTTPHVTT